MILLLANTNLVSAQNLYSGGSGNYNSITWYTNAARTTSCNCTPGASNTINIGNGHSVTIQSGTTRTFAGVVVDDNGNGGTFTIGSNFNSAISLTISGDITVNAGGTFRAGGNGGGTHSLTFQGNISNSNVFDLISGNNDVVNATFAGASTKTISGDGGTFAFNGLTINAGGSNLNINAPIEINGTLNFAANGLLIVDGNSNITLGKSASITNYSSTRYIQLDGTTGADSQLIKISSGTTASWGIVFPVGTATGGYTRLDLTGHVTTSPANNSTLAVKVIYASSVIGRMRRTFRLVVNGNANSTTLTNANFYYNSSTDVSTGDILANYSTLWRLDTSSGAWSAVTGTAPGGSGFFTAPGSAQSLATGTYYYTIGSSTAYSTSTWYSYQTGTWSDPDVWTLDPSGTTLVNPFVQSPSWGDEVVILNGFTVTSDANGILLSATTIEGGATLDMSTTTGHNLGTVTGTGLLRVKGTDLPAGTYSGFVSASNGGTIEYYDMDGTMSSTQTTYNKLILSNSTNAAVTFITAGDLTVNGSFNITQTSGTGTVTWQINNNSSTQRSISLYSDLIVSSNGAIRAGTGNSGSSQQHNLTLYGNFTNNGSVKFFDSTDGQLQDGNYTSGSVYTNALKGNAVTVTFGGVSEQTITCNSQTDFYRFIVDKGTGQQAMLILTASDVNNFRLFGPCNRARSGSAPNYVSNNALSILNGTLQMIGSIDIPLLITDIGSSNSWPIPQNGALWINSPDVTVQVAANTTGGDNRHLHLFGLLRISDGTLNLGNSRGLLGGGSGTLIVEGGTINTWQLRTTNLGSNNNFAYYQSGGTVNVGTSALDGVTINSYPILSLTYPTCTFQMTGGVLNVGNPTTGGTAANGGIQINTASSSTNVTGGTVNIFIPASSTNFTITSTAPFYNLTIQKDGAGSGVAILNGISADDGTTTITETAQPLVVKNDLTLVSANSPTLNCNGYNLTVGGNFNIQSVTTFTPGANTITMNGSGAQSWTHNGTITSLNNIVINKSAGTLTLGGSSSFPDITNLTLTAGTVNDGGKTLTVTGTLSNSAVHAGSGAIIVNGPTAISGTNGIFGNLTIQTNATVSLNGTQTVTGNLRLINANSTMSLGSNSLTVSGNIYTDNGTSVAFTGTKRIITNGLRNDGGLTRKATSGTDLLFPVGTSAAATNYTPVTINITATLAGNITVRPVANAHPNVTSTSQSVQYYWRVTSSGFSGIASVIHKSYTYAAATRDAASVNYRAARFDPSSFTWSYGAAYNSTTTPGTSAIPEFSTSVGWTGTSSTWLDGEYTAGNLSAFSAVAVYYSRASGAWETNTTWSNVGIGGAPATGVPCSTCPVVIGDGAANNHAISVNADNTTSGSLFIATGSTLDCGTYTGLNFGVNLGTGVVGKGTLRIAGTAFPAGDFTNFLGSDGGTVEWYGNTKTIPSTGPAPQNISLGNYYNLSFSPATGQTITLPSNDVVVYNNLTVSGTGTGQVNTNTGATRNINVNNDLAISSGVLSIRNGNVTNLTVNGNTTISTGATFSLQGGGTRTHTLVTSGSIANNGTMQFRNGSEAINVTFNESGNANLTGTDAGAVTTLNILTINKGASSGPTVTFDVAGTVNTLTNNWLVLQNGTFIFNKTGSTFTLTDAASNTYSIPSSAKLKVQNGTVNISNVNSDNSDLLLSGVLEIVGGTVNVGNAANNSSNDIEYASAGTPGIVVSGGSLYVNGAIRRPTSTLAGSLDYNQSAGTVTIGGRNCDVSPNNTRGIFEIADGSTSKFVLGSSALLRINRSTGGSSFADLYLNPVSSSIDATSTIEIGATNLGTQTLSLNIVPAIGNLTILSASGNAQTVNLQSSSLSTAGTLSINTSGILNTNSLDVNIGGDLSIIGTYNGSNNTTVFNGTEAQTATLSSGSTFQNVTVNKPSGTVTLSGTSPTVTNLNLLQGILDVGTLDLVVTGDIVTSSSQIGSGSISLAGGAGVTTQNITSAGGVFTNLTLAGSATSKNVKVDGSLTINGTLNFATANRYLTIGDDLLTFGSLATVSNAGSTTFIRTNGVASDQGVSKNWTFTGSAAAFTYPVGTNDNYTPITFTLTVNSGGDGTLTVIPVNERHPTANLNSSERILDYYWIVSRDGSLSYDDTGSHQYSFPSSLLGGSGGTLTAGYLDVSDPTGWVTSGHGGNATTTSMAFTNMLSTNLPNTGNTYHLTVGTVNTLPDPIIPIYSRLADSNVSDLTKGGNWNSQDSWTLQSDGMGPALEGGVPYGAPVVILEGARINMNVNGRAAFSIRIDGLLVILGNSVGHNLGLMKGTGTLQSNKNTLPAGNYSSFVSSTGGTIEYVGPITMNSRSTYNNLSITGSGTVTMTNTDLTLNGSMNIASGVTLSNAANNRNITLSGNWTNNGTFTPGTGTVSFTGSSAQTISGNTTFNKLNVSKSGNSITLAGTGTTAVTSTLTLTSGYIVSSTSHPVSLPAAAVVSGGSAGSFVDGPFQKVINAAGTFVFPLGSVTSGRYRPATVSSASGSDTWTADYNGNDPTADGLSNVVMNTSILHTVSEFEYWNISRAGSNSASLTLSYNTGSYSGSDIGELANLRMAHWDGTRWDLPPGGGTHTQSGTNIAGTITVTNVTSFSPFTISSLDYPSPLPVRWGLFTADRLDNISVLLKWRTSQEHDNDHFEVQRSEDGVSYNNIGMVEGSGTTSGPRTYQYVDSESSAQVRHYYRIKQVDYEGKSDYSSIAVVYESDETVEQRWNVSSNPSTEGQALRLDYLSDILISDDEKVDIWFASSNGQVVFQNSGSYGDTKEKFERMSSGIKPGVYLLKMTTDGHTESFRIVRY